MPRVRYTAEGGAYRVGGYGFDPGDEKDVDDELAEYLADHDDFEVVEDDVIEKAEGDETDICGAEMSDGDVCERPADECPYHGDDAED